MKASYLDKCIFYTFQGNNVLGDLLDLGYNLTIIEIDDSFDYNTIDVTKPNFLIFNWNRYLPESYNEPDSKSEYSKQGFIFTSKFFEIVRILSQKGFNFLIDNVMEADVYITAEMVFFLEKFRLMNIGEDRLAMLYNNSSNINGGSIKIRDYNLNTLHFPHFFISTLFGLPEPENVEFKKEKDFLILNRRLGFNKFRLLKKIAENDLLDKCLYTILSVTPDTSYAINEYPELKDTAELLGLNRLPITLPKDVAIPFDVLKDDKYLYKLNTDVFFKTKVNIVTETFLEYTDNERFSDTIHITEKSWKAIYMGVPFVISATKGHLDTLRKFGFKTFENIIDESYDYEEDVDVKLNKIVSAAKELAEKCDTKEVLDIIKYNKALFKNVEHKKNILNRFFIKDFKNIFLKNFENIFEENSKYI